MRFTPKTQEELDKEGLLPKGVYDFEVFRAEDKTSKKGNEMIELGIKLFDPNGGTPFVNDYLMEAMAYKLRHFCEVTGLVRQYDDGSLCADDCVGRAGKAKVDIEPAANGYPAKNVIKDYVTERAKDERDAVNTAHKNPPVQGGGDAEDEIPWNKLSSRESQALG